MHVSAADDIVVFVIVVFIGFAAFITGGKIGLMAQYQEVNKLEQECKYLRSLADEDKDDWIKKYAEQKKAAYEAAVKCKKNILLTVTTFNPDGSFNDYDIGSVKWMQDRSNENSFVRFVSSSFSPEEGREFEINREKWLFPIDGKDR